MRVTAIVSLALFCLGTAGASGQSLPNDNDQWGARCASLVQSGGVPAPDQSGIAPDRFEQIARERSQAGQHYVACNLFFAAAAGFAGAGNAQESQTDISIAKVEQKLALHHKLSFMDKLTRSAEVLDEMSKQAAPADQNEMYAISMMVAPAGAPGASGGYTPGQNAAAPQGQYPAQPGYPAPQPQYPPSQAGPPQSYPAPAGQPVYGNSAPQPSYPAPAAQPGNPPPSGGAPSQTYPQPAYPQDTQSGQPAAYPQSAQAGYTAAQPGYPAPQPPQVQNAAPVQNAGGPALAAGVKSWPAIEGHYVCYYYGYTGGSHYIGGMLWPNLGLKAAGIGITVTASDAYDSNFGPGKFSFSRKIPDKVLPEMLGTMTFVSGKLQGRKALLQTHQQFKHAIIFPARWKMADGKSDAFSPADTWCYQKH